jgi:hypothetical protein
MCCSLVTAWRCAGYHSLNPTKYVVHRRFQKLALKWRKVEGAIRKGSRIGRISLRHS